MTFISLHLAKSDGEPGDRDQGFRSLGRRALGIIYFSSNPLPSVTCQLLSSALMAEDNSCSWGGNGKVDCVAEIKMFICFFCGVHFSSRYEGANQK